MGNIASAYGASGDPRAVEMTQGAQRFKDEQIARDRALNNKALQDAAMTAYSGGNPEAVNSRLAEFSKGIGADVLYSQQSDESGEIRHIFTTRNPKTGQDEMMQFSKDELGLVGQDPANLQRIVADKEATRLKERKLEQGDVGLDIRREDLARKKAFDAARSKVMTMANTLKQDRTIKTQLTPEATEYLTSAAIDGVKITTPRGDASIAALNAIGQAWKEDGMPSIAEAQGSFKANSNALNTLVKQEAQLKPFAALAKRNGEALLGVLNRLPSTGASALNSPLRKAMRYVGGEDAKEVEG
jgi:hypothetical protein